MELINMGDLTAGTAQSSQGAKEAADIHVGPDDESRKRRLTQGGVEAGGTGVEVEKLRRQVEQLKMEVSLTFYQVLLYL